MLKKLTAAIIATTAFCSTAFAVDYVKQPPLSSKINSSIADCRTQSILEVPVITWGGDIPTIHANGGKSTKTDSLFDLVGVKAKITRQDIFTRQVEDYLSCKSPLLRGTQGMINMVADITEQDPRTKMVGIYKISWSNGGDALTVKTNKGINTIADLRGKTIAVQAYGPHLDMMTRVLDEAGLEPKDVKIKYVTELTGPKNSPAKAFADDPSVDAAFMIIPDALALAGDIDAIGTGAEGTVKGARILFSTKTMNTIISDVYVVRSDYFQANKKQIMSFVHGLMIAEEEVRNLVKNGGVERNGMFANAAEILLEDENAVADAEALYADALTSGYRGNVKWVSSNEQRSFLRLNNEIQNSFQKIGLMNGSYTIAHAGWDYDQFKEGLQDISGVEKPRFNEAEVAKVLTQRLSQGSLQDDTIIEFEITFKPNSKEFPIELYEAEFNQVIEKSGLWGGAIITIEGHSDPMNYLRQKKNGANKLVLRRIQQSAKNLSQNRASSVREAIIELADSKGLAMDRSQFATLGLGISQPKTGICSGNLPCAPATESEWLSNMRVNFRLVRMEAESSVFAPL